MPKEKGPWDIFVPSTTLIACMTRSIEKRIGRSCNLKEVASVTPMVCIVLWRLCESIASMLESKGGPVGSTFPLTTQRNFLPDASTLDAVLDTSFAGSIIYRTGCIHEEREVFKEEIAKALISLARMNTYVSSWWRLELFAGQAVIHLTDIREKELPTPTP